MMIGEKQGQGAVVAGRRPWVPDETALYKGHDLFPTPPWATRALTFASGQHDFAITGTVWDPCAGFGHMSDVLAEIRHRHVVASDLTSWGAGAEVFIHGGCDARHLVGAFLKTGENRPPDWIVTNPPFRLAELIAFDALALAMQGVALLVRLQFLETASRWRLFARRPPSHVFVFSGRVAMVEGGWDPAASSATSYAWVVWQQRRPPPVEGRGFVGFPTSLIPPDAKKLFTRADDVARFAHRHVPGWVPPSQARRERARTARGGDHG